MKSKIKFLIKALLSIGLLYLVISQIELKKLSQILKEANIAWLAAAFIFYNLSKIVSSFRLNLYFRDIGVYLEETRALKLYYLGMFYNMFLPGGIGGDGYKIFLLKKRFATSAKDLLSALFIDRVSGVTALIVLAAILFFFSDFSARFSNYKSIAFLTVLLSYPLFIWSHKRFFKKFDPSLSKTTFLGMAVQLLQLLSAFFIILALNVEPSSIIDFLFLFLVSSIVAVLPLTVGGVGAREFTFLYGLSLIGSEPAQGVAFSFMFFLITLLSSAIGVAFLNEDGYYESLGKNLTIK